MHPDGTLDWTPPPGNWVVLRFGYSLLGITNHPATAEATGLEVDKMDRRYVKKYMDTYLDSYKETVGPDLMGKRGLHYVVNDSWEAGAQNWTDNMIAQFKRLRGYDPAALDAGSRRADRRERRSQRQVPVGLPQDHRRPDRHRTLRPAWRPRCTSGAWATTANRTRRAAPLIADGMEVKKFNEIPMSAMWVQLPGVNKPMYGYNADDRESASVAHIYGQNLAAAESMTACTAAAAWAWSPATLRPTADMEFLNGINRIVIHESAHQPLIDKAPGMTLGPCGQWFNRNETWAEQAGPWVDYLARTSFLLQQGHFGADLIYFYGEDSNLTAIFVDKSPNVPAGYGFDYVNADALIHELSVANGRITTPGGMSYRAARPRSLQPAHVAARAARHPQAGDRWSNRCRSKADRRSQPRRRSGRVPQVERRTLRRRHRRASRRQRHGLRRPESWRRLQGAPCRARLRLHQARARTLNLLFVHRKLADGDLYFVDNRSDRAEQVDATFRVTGKAPELWHADTGKTEPVSFKIADGRTTVPLNLEPWGSVFVVFRKPTSANFAHSARPRRYTAHHRRRSVESQLPARSRSAGLDHARQALVVERQPGPRREVLLRNSPPTQRPSKCRLPGSRPTRMSGLTLAMSRIWPRSRSMANRSGIVWHAPYRVDATAALKPGANEISIKVTNAWVNRLIGDEQPNAVKITFADVKPYKADSPLLPSGLLGPVTLHSITTK